MQMVPVRQLSGNSQTMVKRWSGASRVRQVVNRWSGNGRWGRSGRLEPFWF